MRFSTWGLNYITACDLIDDLKKFEIESNITIGGIAIYPDGTIQVDKMNLMCAKYHTKAICGATPFEENIIYFGT
ncbi:hypothetical protein GQ473_03015 [archaeon]|nr:hypothetical protein [archaeon]